MAEKADLLKQYDYKVNANLVLAPGRRRKGDEPSGAPETLWGKMEGTRFGDRARAEKPPELTEKLEKLRDKKRKKRLDEQKGRRRHEYEAGNVLAATEMGTEDVATYHPRSTDTRAAFEALLTFVQEHIGAQPHDVLRSAAMEILSILKNDKLTDPQRKVEVAEITSALPDGDFHSLVDIGKKITDYSAEEVTEGAGGKLDDEHGVAVVFDDDDDMEDDDLVVREESDDDDVDAEGPEDEELLPALAQEGEDEMDTDAADQRDALDPTQIDAYWLQREVSRFIDDEHRAQQVAGEVLGVLGEKDIRACENKLVMLLDYDRFDFIKILLKNRALLYYITRLKQAQSEDARAAVEAEMMNDPDGEEVLQALHHLQSGAERRKDFELKVREEARSLRAKVRGEEEGATTGKSSLKANVIDLEALAFSTGGHFMSNKRCELPPGSFQTHRKGYEEVYVPALKPPEFTKGEHMVEINELPDWAQSAFPKGVNQLNRVQSRTFETAFNTSENLLLAAPTGAGKTNVALLTMLREIGLHRDERRGNVDLDSFKIIYVAPMKSLVAEMVNNFSQRLEPYGVTVKELTGDMSLTKQQIYETQVIVCTPEKWDIITRKAGERTFTQLVRLVILDEIHLLHDERGPVLESLVARTVRQIEATQELVRIVALSATLPNYEDVAAFLRVSPERGIFFFDNSYRPVPLDQQFVGITEKKPLKRFQLANEIVYEKVMDNAGKNQVLIFVHSRKETAKTARFLRDLAIEKDTLGRFLREDSASREILRAESESESIRNQDLRDLLPYGFACHHAGMMRTDRTLVEDLFADGHIQVLVSTATLAWGVNLPAHTVIIKGTQLYDPMKGKWVELSFLDIMQMLGRAGRPQYDSKGEGIVITQHAELQYYLSVMNQQLPIESQALSKLADNLNAEIVLGTIRNVQEAIEWLAYTYLYVRMLRNPQLYGISEQQAAEDKLLVQRRRDLIHSAALVLDRTGLIRYDRRTGLFQTTDLGRVASHYYVSHTSLATFNEHLKPTLSDIEVFRLFSLSHEFNFINVREEEKVELQKLLERVPIPVKESCEEPSAKVNVLLQSYISQLPLSGFALLADMVYVTQSAVRIVRALFEIVLRRGWAQLALKLLALAKMIDKRMWSSQSPLRQFKSIPEELIVKIEKKDIPWERLSDLSPQEIGELVRFERMGRTVYQTIHKFPKLELRAHVQPITRSMLQVELTITPDFQFDEKVHGNSEPFWIIVEDTDSEQVLHQEYFVLKKRYSTEEHIVSFTVPIFEPLPPQYFIRVLSDRWLHCETLLPISFRHLILPEKFAPMTELLDLQPLPVSALRNAEFEALYDVSHFNPIQTQAFTSLFNSDENILLCAPTGSGKTFCAEFALLRRFLHEPDATCVYVAPLHPLCDQRFQDWSVKFGKLGKTVAKMSGSVLSDTKLLDKAHIVIATGEQWDMVSRRWKQRRAVQNVSLFIVDELHLIGGRQGPLLEIIISRMRFIASQMEKPIRIIGLTASLANAKDVGDWIGAGHHSLFAFHPNVRPVPLEIHIQGFETADFVSRMMAMSRPAFNAIVSHGGNKPVIVYAPNRKQAKLLAGDIVAFAAADGDAQRFLRCAPEDIKDMVEIKEEEKHRRSRALAAYAMMGVVFFHDGLDVRDRKIARDLFDSGAASVLVADSDSCWLLDVAVHLVVIVGTERYDGHTHSYADYPITDILQMMGRACRPRLDDSGKCVILCYAPRKEFFKKFLYEPFPVESHLDHYLADHMNAEVVTRTIENKQDAVDYLTWSFYYRRLTMNANYYTLQGTSHRHVSDHLSELVETTLTDLEQSRCVAIEDEMDLSPLNLGMIAAYYYLRYTTVELFASSLEAKTRLRGVQEIISHASEFEEISVRDGEEQYLAKLASRLPLPVPGEDNRKFSEASTKINLLLQAHYSRMPLGMNQRADLRKILKVVPRLFQATVDVVASNGWLRPAMAAMELSQMVSQGVWNKDPFIKQLPFFSDEVIKRCQDAGIESVYDVMEAEDSKREELLQMEPKEMAEVAAYCNRYPSIDVSYSIVEADELIEGNPVSVQVELEREVDEEESEAGPGPVIAPFYPDDKEEGWWLVVGDPDSNQLLCIKRVSVAQRARARLQFEAPTAGEYKYKLYFMCDSYVGCDQEFELALKIQSGAEGGQAMEDE